jgi:hypothetical protein
MIIGGFSRHRVGLNGSRAVAPPLLYLGRRFLLCFISKWQVPRRRCRSPAPEYLLLEEEEDGGLDCFFKFSLWSSVLILWTPV